MLYIFVINLFSYFITYYNFFGFILLLFKFQIDMTHFFHPFLIPLHFLKNCVIPQYH